MKINTNAENNLSNKSWSNFIKHYMNVLTAWNIRGKPSKIHVFDVTTVSASGATLEWKPGG